MECKIEISARHIHFSKEDAETLFGKSEFTKIKELSQKDFACEETVSIVGPKRKLENVRFLLPFRENSQLEISRTDSISLGIDAPLKLSGQTPGAKIKIIGPASTIEKEIAIVANRHLHLSPSQASSLGLGQDDVVAVKIKGSRGLVFDNIIVRVKDIFNQSIHIDTDEANAAGLVECSQGELIIH